LLSGCAAAPETDAQIPPDWPAPAPDSDARARARTHVALAAQYLQAGKNEVALDELNKALKIDPDFADAHDLGGLIYMALGEPAQAQAHLQRAIALDARDANALHNLGWLLCQEKHFDPADTMFERALAVPGYGQQAKTLMAQGVCQARAGLAAKAEATLMRSYQLDAGNPVTGYNLSQLLYQRGDYARALFYVQRLNNSELANAESLWLGIQVEHRLDNPVAVEQLASQLRRRFPRSHQLQTYERGAFDD
jgi:type IV pilus assembly protein PilF